MFETAVLLVEFDTEERQRIGAWLEEEGYDVLTCPGPSAPEYTCLAGRGEPCPLAGEPGIVVLDLALASDVHMTGTPGWELLLYYATRDKNIVAISRGEDAVHPYPDEQVSVIRRPPEREVLLAAVHTFHERLMTQRGGGRS